MSINIGLIGGGYWGKNLIREFNKSGVLHTICDSDKEVLLKHKNDYPEINVTENWSDIITNDVINAVCISLPAEMHYKYVKEALIANKDVFVEKPITLDLEEAIDLVNIASKYNRILMVGHLLHYHPCIAKIKKLISEDKIGKIINIVCNRLNLGKFRAQENVLWSFAPHDISVCLSLCDNMVPYKMTCHGQIKLQEGIHDITNSIIESCNGVYININVNWLNPYKEQRMVIIGEKGMIEFNDTLEVDKLLLYEDYIEWSDTTPRYPNPIKNAPTSIPYDTSKSPLLTECEHFISCCQSRKQPITDGDEGVRVLKVLKGLQSSLELGGKSVYLPKNTSVPITSMPITSFISDKTSIIDKGAIIGKNTKIWQFTHICSNAKLGENCNIGQNVYIAPGAILGDNCKVQNNVSIYSGVNAGNNVFFGPSCVLTNDINPRSMYPKNGKYIETIICDNVTIGANATIICGIELGRGCFIGAGAVVTKDVEAYSIVVGNPAKKIGLIDDKGIRTII